MAVDRRIPDHIEEEATRWVIERDDGLTPAKELDLAAWIAADPMHQRALAKAETIWHAMSSAPVKAEINRRRAPGIVPHPAIPGLHGLRTRTRWIPAALAASMALVFVGAVQDWPTRLRADAITATGERRDVTLADGSVVQLNTGSAIAIDYREHRRIVRLLKGEAAFTVAADRSRPFTVEAGEGATTALGTRFIIRRDGTETDVAVTEHRVRVAWPAGKPNEAIDLDRGQATRYGPKGLAQIHAIDVGASSSWTRGRLVFVDRPLGEVVAELGRYHKGYIHVIGDDLAQRRVSGIFRTDDPVAAVDTLQRLLGIGSMRLTDRLILLHV